MSKINNRLFNSKYNKDCNRKCSHHLLSHNYVSNLKKHNEVVQNAFDLIDAVNMSKNITVRIIFHFLAPVSSYDKEKVYSRANDIILSLNDDFNNYSSNFNTMNNFKYKSI